MDDVFFKKLKQVNISEDTEKTKARLERIWDNADKKNKKELLNNAGGAIYNAIGKIKKSGRITAKMTILLSRYLDINPLYLIGTTDDRDSYSEILLKEFLIRLGYKNLWKEYENYLIKFDMENTGDDEVDEEEYMPETAGAGQGAKEKDDETKFSEFVAAIAAENACQEEAEAPDRDNTQTGEDLTDEEAMVLLRALFIRAKANPEIEKAAVQIKSLLLLS